MIPDDDTVKSAGSSIPSGDDLGLSQPWNLPKAPNPNRSPRVLSNST
jgi:hypothetical protein